MKPTLTFLGAAGTVTGSKTLVTFRDKRYLVDCGLFQGPKELRDRNRRGLLADVGTLEAVFLTHAHLDHSGFLPCLHREGYAGPVYVTQGTRELCRIILPDAGFLEEEQAAYANRTGYSNHKPAIPLFTVEDCLRALELMRPVERHEWRRINEDLEVRFWRAGHIIGASFLEMRFSAGGKGPASTVVFSGDVGRPQAVLMRPPEALPAADLLVLESTYGGRRHPGGDVRQGLADIVNRTAQRGGVLVVPAFAVGRAQDLLYLIRVLEDEGRIPKLDVVLDSPMAIAATHVLEDHHEDHVLGPFTGGNGGLRPRRFRACRSADESMLVCMQDGPLIVVSSSGMLSGGRILHHLKARLPDSRNTVLFTGYQAEGTKGRYLQANAGTAKTIRIHHQEVPIEAEIATLDELSAHADEGEMLAWLRSGPSVPRRIILNHGSPEGAAAFGQKLRESLGVDVVAADMGVEIAL